MNRMRFVTIALVLSGLAYLNGCGDGPDNNTAFNRPIGDGPASTPTSVGDVDSGILGDPSAYQPTSFDAIQVGEPSPTPAGGGAGASAGGSTGGDTGEVLEVLNDLQTAALDGQITDVLDLFVDDQVQSLRDGEFVDTAEDIYAGLTTAFETLQTKSAGTDLDTGDEADFTAMANIAKAAMQADFTSETTAKIVLDVDALKSSIQANREALVAMMSAGPNMGQPGGDPSSQIDEMLAQMDAAPIRRLPLLDMVNIDGDWRISLPVTITADQADAINEAGLAVKDLLDQLNEQLETYDQIASGELMGIGMGMAGNAMGTFQGQIMPLMMPVITEWQAEMAENALNEAPAGTMAAPSFTDDVLANVIIDRCQYCHQEGGNAFDKGLPIDLSIENAYASLTTMGSVKDPDLKFVVPGDAEASYLYRKIVDDAPAHGRMMPIGDDPLDADEVAMIKAWIMAGAPDN